MTKQYIMIFDLDKCSGCKACSVACHNEYDMAPGVNFCRVDQVGPTGVYPDLKMSFFPRTCMHCSNPPCLEACSEKAVYIHPDGIVIFDEKKCTDCMQCVAACPYDVVFHYPEKKIVHKCNMCLHLITKGGVPNCVSNCPCLAIYFGDINDPSSEVSKIMKENKGNIFRDREELKANPNVYYLPVKNRTINNV